MSSLRSRLFLALLRHRHLFRPRGPNPQPDWLTGLPEVRRQSSAAARLLGRLPRGMVSLPLTLGPGEARWIGPAGTLPARERAILYFHGGGYVLGEVEDHQAIVAKFAAAAGLPALLFAYRLAPEHPHPAALEDALIAYRHLLGLGIPVDKIAFAGDSAGGGLALAALLAARDAGLPLPGAAAALSPWTDLAFTGESYRENASACLSPPGSWQACRAHYIGERDPRHPHISPLYGDLGGLPPLLIFAGEKEVLRDDSVAFAAKAQAAGSPVELEIGQGLFHCYPACAPLFPEASRAMRRIGRFISGHLEAGRAV